MTLVQILTALLAVYGALLSTANLAVLLRSKRWRVHISVGVGNDPHFGETISLHIANLGERPITLIDIWMNELPYVPFWLRMERLPRRDLIQRLRCRRSSWPMFFKGEWIVNDPYPFPVEIMPGRTVTIQLDTKGILDTLTDSEPAPACIFFTVEDAVKNEHYSPPFYINIKSRKIDFLEEVVR